MISVDRATLVAAFTEWDREYREDPDSFMSTVEHLLRNTPETYGDGAADTLLAYIERLAQ